MDSASVLVIGNEVLTGKVEEVNARFLISALRAEGVRLDRVCFVRDEPEAIAEEVRRMSERSTHVFTAGGVGGTHDDITMGAVAQAFGVSLRSHPELLGLLEGFYGDRMTPAHRRMADLPEGAELLIGEGQKAPVVRMRNVFVLPGAPRFLRMKFPVLRPLLRGAEVWLAEIYLSVHEEQVADLLAGAEAADEGVEVGSYPRFDADPPWRVKVTIEGPSELRVAAVAQRVCEGLEAGALVEQRPAHRVGGPGLSAGLENEGLRA